MELLLNPGEFHALSPADRPTLAWMREALDPYKGLLSGAALREPFNHMMAQTPPAVGVTYEAATVGGVPGWWCHPAANQAPASAVLYLHGGAYVAGSAESYRPFAGQLAACAGVDLFVADYRLAPEHPFPAAVLDAQATYQGLVALGRRRVAIGGDSAGGGLALVTLALTTHAAATDPALLAPCAGVALSPWVDLAQGSASMHTRAEADFLATEAWLSRNAADYLQGHPAQDPQASPVYGQLAGLPPLQLHVGNDEVLRDDAVRYADRARAAGVQVDLHVWEGMPHVFPANVSTLEAADHALGMISTFLQQQLVGVA